MKFEVSLPFQSNSFIWKACIPPKIKVFSLLLAMGKFNSLDILQKCKPYLAISSAWCVLFKMIDLWITNFFNKKICPLAACLSLVSVIKRVRCPSAWCVLFKMIDLEISFFFFFFLIYYLPLGCISLSGLYY
ncbi:hypothetical protein TorRG33x02_318010 [Trema orientale]|uniref:Uncharacterized protein n=1 Tax=Trema orientale TaxID=63057 RepID=A0A2P5BKH0_TREOI|nr:hypothetical protein TorRG33x02_318010 [Trema orientale]